MGTRGWQSMRRCTLQMRHRPYIQQAQGRLEVYAISDLHTDHPENLAWVESLEAPCTGAHTALILAGDVSDDLRLLRCAAVAMLTPLAMPCSSTVRCACVCTYLPIVGGMRYAPLPLYLACCMLLCRRTLQLLKDKYDTVLFVPGNHELWVSPPSPSCWVGLRPKTGAKLAAYVQRTCPPW